MLVWLQTNLATIVISFLLLLTVGLIIRGMLRDKKWGRSSCGACGACGVCGACGSGGPCGGCQVCGSAGSRGQAKKA